MYNEKTARAELLNLLAGAAMPQYQQDYAIALYEAYMKNHAYPPESLQGFVNLAKQKQAPVVRPALLTITVDTTDAEIDAAALESRELLSNPQEHNPTFVKAAHYELYRRLFTLERTVAQLCATRNDQ